ncbi:MAG TPA: chlorite dismutase family protein [Gemmatimonadaceae bacterium]
MKTAQSSRAQPPETLEGWYAQHQIFTIDRATGRGTEGSRGDIATQRVESTQQGGNPSGWDIWVRLIGSKADLMSIRFAPTLDDIGDTGFALRRAASAAGLRLDSSFLSVTEAGLYHLTAELARETAERGGTVGDEAYSAELARRVAKERQSSHVQRRLFPALPEGLPYVCFYPMSKRRVPGQNWYALSLDDRSRLMQAHGKTGRRYAGRVLQIITGAIGFEQWEWGVTLFAADPLDFKKLVTDMRFDEVSAEFAEFGEFFVGKLMAPGELDRLLETA